MITDIITYGFPITITDKTYVIQLLYFHLFTMGLTVCTVAMCVSFIMYGLCHLFCLFVEHCPVSIGYLILSCQGTADVN